jgi:DNA-directed RNA polymerase beta subunit
MTCSELQHLPLAALDPEQWDFTVIREEPREWPFWPVNPMDPLDPLVPLVPKEPQWSELTVTEQKQALRIIGRLGKNYCYNPWNGERMPNVLFCGVGSYGRLTKFSSKQIKVRNATGGFDCLVRQPVKCAGSHGAPRLGGLCLASINNHGASGLAQDKLLHSSDLVEVLICQQCKTMARHAVTSDTNTAHPLRDEPVDGAFCDFCQTSLFIKLSTLPFSTEHVLQHIRPMGYTPQFETGGVVGPTPIGRPPDVLPRSVWG